MSSENTKENREKPEFLRLSIQEQAGIVAAMSARMGRPAQVLQKDIWVCWVLKELFQLEHAVRMAFKGGTSLSKVFHVIERFSEDIDVTLYYRDLVPGIESELFEGKSQSPN